MIKRVLLSIMFIITVLSVILYSQDAFNSKTLHIGAESGNIGIVKKCIESGVDINGVLDGSLTALHYACRKGHNEIVKYLIEKGANLEALADKGVTPLLVAVANKRIETVKILAKHGAKIDFLLRGEVAILHLAVEKSSLDMVKAIVECGADLELKDNNMNRTPLCIAALMKKEKKIEYLLSKGALVDAKDHTGNTPTSYYLTFGKNEDLAVKMINKSKNVKYKIGKGYTLLHLACQNMGKKSVELLLEKGLDINVKTDSGTRPIASALLWGNDDVAELLLEKGAKIDFVNSRGSTILHFAASSCKKPENILGKLVKKGAKLDAIDNKKRTPLMLAMKYRRYEIADKFIELGAKLNLQDRDGSTVLHYAAKATNMWYPAMPHLKEYIETIKLLIKKGADADIKNNSGKKPIDIAKNSEVKKILDDSDDSLKPSKTPEALK